MSGSAKCLSRRTADETRCAVAQKTRSEFDYERERDVDDAHPSTNTFIFYSPVTLSNNCSSLKNHSPSRVCYILFLEYETHSDSEFKNLELRLWRRSKCGSQIDTPQETPGSEGGFIHSSRALVGFERWVKISTH